jgi:SAM-dependent methyltransferase
VKISRCGGRDYDWSRRGDEWADTWGGVPYQWWTTLFPRIQGYVPVRRILEIAPGYGRWTHFIRDLCDELIIVDTAAEAIDYCRERFKGDARVRAYVNDGNTLPEVSDESIDFVFSFDSLVHAESTIIACYMLELARVLSEDGAAFIHHSNMGSYGPGTYDQDNIHWRAKSVSAELIEQLAERVDLRCISQETVAWGNETLLTDCFTVLVRRGSEWDRDNVRVAILDFTSHEIAIAQRFSEQYPPYRSELRVRLADPTASAKQHAEALRLAEYDQLDAARKMLGDQLRRAIDPEVLNDLAVLELQRGHPQTARDLLGALVALHPAYEPGIENLRFIDEHHAALSRIGDVS